MTASSAGHATEVGHRDGLDTQGHDIVDGGARRDLGAGGRVGADDRACGDLVVEGVGALTGLEARIEQLVERHPRRARRGGRAPRRARSTPGDHVVDGGAGRDLGAGGGIGADDGTRGDLVVEGVAALTGLEAGVDELVEGILGRHAAEVGHRDGLDTLGHDVVDGRAGRDLGARGGSVLMTAPAATSSSKASLRSPGSRPASMSWLRASSAQPQVGTATGRVGSGSAWARHRGRRRSRRWCRGDLGAGGRVGADDGARGDLVVEGVGPLTGHETGVDERVHGILDGHATQVGHRDGLDTLGHDVVDGVPGATSAPARDRC